MREVHELLDPNDPGIEKIRKWLRSAANDFALLPPSGVREHLLWQQPITLSPQRPQRGEGQGLPAVAGRAKAGEG
ncbi:MAG TPA: hypothetical protein VNU68_27340 [Verrucomicrobiae bacterium]|nr:hypothetical protein [Verrucomicrobiae bacterium]